MSTLTAPATASVYAVIARRLSIPARVRPIAWLCVGAVTHLADVPDGRLPEPVEAGAYYLIAEALTNVSKYAEASAVRVRVAVGAAHLVVEVADDGIGGADPAGGSGLRGLADRVEALGGSLEVVSPEGGGTTLRAEIPLLAT